MSATVETTNVAWRKRQREEDPSDLQVQMKKPRYYYYRLASESSKNSAEEDTESIYSVQDRETDFVRDTSDTDSKSGEEYEVIEYEVASLSESDHGIIGNSTSDSDDQVIFAAAIGAMCDSSLETTWITDWEDSDNSSLDDSVVLRLGFSTCVQCKSKNDNPLFRYCEKCYQQTCKQCKKRKTYKCFPLCISCHKDRKKFYPPRPRGNKKPRRKVTEPPVKLDTLRSCLNGLSSQDSGIGSSQECPPLELDRIVVPDNLKPGTSSLPVLHKEDIQDTEQQLKRKRQLSESSLSDFDIKKSKLSRNIAPRKEHYRPSTRNFVKRSLSKDKSSSEGKILSHYPSDSGLDEKSVSLTHTSTGSSQKSIEMSKSSDSLTKESSVSSQESVESLPLLALNSRESSLALSQTSTETLSSSQKSTDTLGLSQKSEASDQSMNLRSHTRLSSQSTEVTGTSTSTNNPESELCIMCNSAPKDSIFLHTNIGHQCCCYKCAKRTLHTIKRCPICYRSVNKVVRIFQS